jgi:ligand-binding SRPBCC domain-containing protein
LKHEHHFSQKENKTVMTDVFIYASPLGFIGRLADIIFLKSYMEKLLLKRNAIVKEFAETDKWKEII